MTEPTFNYPTGNDDVWVKCERDDKEAEYYWCNCHHSSWMHKSGFPQMCVIPGEGLKNNCGQIWRKRVKVPEGWEVAPTDYVPQGGDKYLGKSGEWKDVEASYTMPIAAWNVRSGYQWSYIRPSAKASEGEKGGVKASTEPRSEVMMNAFKIVAEALQRLTDVEQRRVVQAALVITANQPTEITDARNSNGH